MDPLQIAIIGCGNRCRMYKGATDANDDAAVILLCDMDITRAQTHAANFPAAKLTTELSDVMNHPDVQAVIIATPDGTHCKIATEAIRAGKHVLLEKPLALDIEEAQSLLSMTDTSDLVLQLAFTLRASPFYHTVHSIVQSGEIGRVVGIEAAEHMGRDHGASYMRRWQRFSKLSGGLLMNKCCHDIDLLHWFADASARQVASFGGRDFFNAGRHTATHCSLCDEADSCHFRYTGSHVSATEKMKADPTKYDLDLCVFTSDKDIVDNQVVILEYENNVRATFTVQMFADQSDRTIHITGTKGFLKGSFLDNTIRVYSDGDGFRDQDVKNTSIGSHGGGDAFLVRNFIDSIRGKTTPLSCCADGVENTITCIAADVARTEQRVVRISEFCSQ